MFRRIACVLAAAALAACTSMGRVEQGATLKSGSKDTFFVLGVKPDNYRVYIFQGSVKEGVFKQNPWLSATFMGAAENGYVVGKTGSDGPLAITMVNVVTSANAILGTVFTPCGDARTVVFSVPHGRVIYIGDLAYDFRGNGLRIIESSNLQAAREHLRTAYPQLADSLEQGSYEVMPTATSCTQTITIPIYLPSR